MPGKLRQGGLYLPLKPETYSHHNIGTPNSTNIFETEQQRMGVAMWTCQGVYDITVTPDDSAKIGDEAVTGENRRKPTRGRLPQCRDRDEMKSH
jgi:hypothetical protein